MKKKKLLSLTLIVCMLVTMLAGCGGSSAASTDNSSAAAPAAESSAAGGEETAAAALDSLPAAVGEGTITASPEFYASTDLSKDYTVNMYLIGDVPNDWDKVLSLVNEYLKPYNTQLAVTFMSWSDYQTMYSLVLAGGEQVDLLDLLVLVFNGQLLGGLNGLQRFLGIVLCVHGNTSVSGVSTLRSRVLIYFGFIIVLSPEFVKRGRGRKL